MKVIILSFTRPANTRPITTTELRLRKGEIGVYYSAINRLGTKCSEAYADSIELRGLGKVVYLDKFLRDVFPPDLMGDGIFHGVLTDTRGPQGYAIEFFEASSPREHKKKRLRSGPALRSDYTFRYKTIQALGRSLAKKLRP